MFLNAEYKPTSINKKYISFKYQFMDIVFKYLFEYLFSTFVFTQKYGNDNLFLTKIV